MAKKRARYVAPMARGTYRQGRTDQGVDFVTHKGNAIMAIGDAVIDFVGPYQGFGPTYIAYHLTSGPHKGEEIFIGHSQAIVKVGQRVVAGATVARAAGFETSTYGKPQVDVEIGFAQRSGTYLPMAKIRGGYTEGQVTSEGQRFKAFLTGLATGNYAASAEPAPDTAAAPTQAAPADPMANVIPDQSVRAGTATAPESSVAGFSEPGSTGPSDFGPRQASDTWQLIASQPLASPESQANAQRSLLAAGG